MLCFYVVHVQCGVIECVPDSKSRDQLGKQTEMCLLEYFEITHGKEDTAEFQLVSGLSLSLSLSFSLSPFFPLSTHPHRIPPLSPCRLAVTSSRVWLLTLS